MASHPATTRLDGPLTAALKGGLRRFHYRRAVEPQRQVVVSPLAVIRGGDGYIIHSIDDVMVISPEENTLEHGRSTTVELTVSGWPLSDTIWLASSIRQATPSSQLFSDALPR